MAGLQVDVDKLGKQLARPAPIIWR